MQNIKRFTVDALETIEPELRGAVEADETYVYFADKRVRLHFVDHSEPVEENPGSVHCHFIALISGTDSPLEACMVGAGDNRDEAYQSAVEAWIRLVCPVILSLLHARPCLGTEHFDGTEGFGVAGHHGFTGLMKLRALPEDFDIEAFADAPIHDFAATIAPAQRIHLSKAVIQAVDGIWTRMLEVDGHEALHIARDWQGASNASDMGYVVQFAIFWFTDEEVAERARLDAAIEDFIRHFETSHSLDLAADRLEDNGFSVELAWWIHSFVPLAACRYWFAELIAYCPDYNLVHQDGSVTNHALMSNPIFARSVQILTKTAEAGRDEVVKELALTSGEFKAVNKALHHGESLETFTMLPPYLTDLDVADDVYQRAYDRIYRST